MSTVTVFLKKMSIQDSCSLSVLCLYVPFTIFHVIVKSYLWFYAIITPHAMLTFVPLRLGKFVFNLFSFLQLCTKYISL
jgi:hypothetical protein